MFLEEGYRQESLYYLAHPSTSTEEGAPPCITLFPSTSPAVPGGGMEEVIIIVPLSTPSSLLSLPLILMEEWGK